MIRVFKIDKVSEKWNLIKLRLDNSELDKTVSQTEAYRGGLGFPMRKSRVA
jgi:hypothetical protein